MTFNFWKIFLDGRALLSMCMLGFAAAAPVVVSGGGGEGAAGGGLDATLGDSAEGGAGEGDGGEPDAVDVSASADGTQPGSEQAQAGAGAEPDIDGRKISPGMRKLRLDLKTANPALLKEVDRYVFGYKGLKDKIAQAFPERGLEEAVELKGKVESLGGLEVIDDLQNEVGEYRQLDESFINGDPAFIEAAVSKYPDGFKKLMPVMSDRWAEVDPDGYNRHHASVAVATLHQGNFTTNLYMALNYLKTAGVDSPQVQEAINLLTANNEFISNLNKLATSKPAAPEKDPRAEEIAREKAELEQRQTTFFNQGIKRDFDAYIGPKIDAELKPFLNGNTLTDYQRDIINRDVAKEMLQRMSQDENFDRKGQSYQNSRDHSGLMTHLKGRADKLLAATVKSVYTRLFGQPKLGSPKPASAIGTAPNGQKPQKPGQQPSKPQQVAGGWIKLAEGPKPEEIDTKRNKAEGVSVGFDRASYLKNGKKVFWGDKAPVR